MAAIQPADKTQGCRLAVSSPSDRERCEDLRKREEKERDGGDEC